ncbi:hypothetical protein L9F63_002367, partial [Diploptera punctata]
CFQIIGLTVNYANWHAPVICLLIRHYFFHRINEAVSKFEFHSFCLVFLIKLSYESEIALFRTPMEP